MLRNIILIFSLFAILIVSGCTQEKPQETVTPVTTTVAPTAAPTVAPPVTVQPPSDKSIALGGRLYDKWYGELSVDAPATMTDGSGATVENTGHSFRCKNCHGWDYRGSEGIYGPSYQNKDYVVSGNLYEHGKEHAEAGELDELVEVIRDGTLGMPAFGDHLSDQDMTALATFITEMVNPADILTLDASKSYGYTLKTGASQSNGDALYAAKCTICHGADGTAIYFGDGKYSLATHSRMKAYEDHHKIANGHPGSTMGGQYTEAADILDVLAALCDTTKYLDGTSTGANEEKARDGCGDYYVE